MNDHILSHDAAILSRLIDPGRADLPSKSVQALLRLRFGQQDLDRMHELATKNQDALTEAEKSEMASYCRIGLLIDLMHSLARRSLQQRRDESTCQPTPATPLADPLLGSMREYADELDAIVEDAMRRRQVSGWLPSKDDFDTLEWACTETGRSLYDMLDEALKVWLQPWRQRKQRTAAGE